MEIALVIGLLIIAIILFATEKYSVDVVTIGLLLVLTLAGTITPQEAFAGFSSDFIIILASIFVISGALSETGLLDKVGSQLIKVVKSKTLFVGYTMFITGFLSAFMNNTTVTALVTGPVIGMCRKLSLSPSKVLIPVAFASILGGTCTLIGTSTNVAVSGYIAEQGMEALHFFEIFLIGMVFLATGIIFILLFYKKLLPDYSEGGYNERYDIAQYLSEIVISEKSPLVGQVVFQSDLAKRDVRILKIIRKKEDFIPNSLTTFQAKDILLVECSVDELIRIKETPELHVFSDTIKGTEIAHENIVMAELLITPGSGLINRSLKEARFRQNYNLVALAMQRFGGTVSQKIGGLKLKIGDTLLVQGTQEDIDTNRNSNDFSIVGDFKVNMFKERKGIFTAIIFLVAIIAGTLELAPLSITFMAAALMTVLSGAINIERVYQLINWKLLILIGGMTAFGTAMENSGASQYLAELIVQLLGDFGPYYVMAGFVILVILLTQPMSNAAAALVLLPVAIQTAEILGANPRTFAIAIMLGASVSLIAPFEPSCILVFAPGKYKFKDFIKVGLPLTIILFVLLMLLVPVFWPL
ncbi:SLC13 family permease [Subsaxibacter sp. CAU 1640]|uniref:SLC13 family permease n=1 Tax=Subsaxibacter sp. CAU 1640 TaxID=2933271 RepID=UPI002004CB11|nr:SLC13 family permease [Subsaxibacter sp. CAU 1640]MCK7588959.1 SLC13 family permease [Subsaxibacter sp. CAU 1640]